MTIATVLATERFENGPNVHELRSHAVRPEGGAE